METLAAKIVREVVRAHGARVGQAVFAALEIARQNWKQEDSAQYGELAACTLADMFVRNLDERRK